MAPLHPPRAATGERLVPRDALPPQLRPLFHHEYFNSMQSAVFELAFGSDTPLVVAAPTGSGKTAVLELALARLWSTQSDDVRPAAVYIAPLKALTTERLNDWAPRFSAALGIKCCELTGDSVEDEEQHAGESLGQVNPLVHGAHRVFKSFVPRWCIARSSLETWTMFGLVPPKLTRRVPLEGNPHDAGHLSHSPSLSEQNDVDFHAARRAHPLGGRGLRASERDEAGRALGAAAAARPDDGLRVVV